ncbi:MAG: hypothetical protein LBS12_07750 [Prevotellaceae bacterium]|jgi:hypothetical protein|nr:hypothetical protein [Prevotellaceae bacterium]
MKQNPILLHCAVALMALAACSQAGPNDPNNPNNPDATTRNLSASGTANCYIVTGAGRYSFDATVIGNGAAGIIDPAAFHAASAAIAPVSARLLWQDYYESGTGLISSIELDGGRVLFTVAPPFVSGNAVIAVYDADNTILWSWHIWMPEGDVASLPAETGYEVMDRNLGALTGALTDAPTGAPTYGMLYQWGRKDPFPAAATLLGNTATLGAPLYDAEGQPVVISNSSWSDITHNTLLYAIRNPTVCLSNYAQYGTSRDWLQAGRGSDALWGNPEGYVKDAAGDYINKGVKSCYDPCPPGWRVPPAGVFRTFTPSGGYEWGDANDIVSFNIVDITGDGLLSLADYNYGWQLYLNSDPIVTSHFPAAARFDGSYAMLMGSMSGLWGSYWGNSPYPSDNTAGLGFAVLAFQTHNSSGSKSISASPAAGGARADAYSIRCIK